MLQKRGCIQFLFRINKNKFFEATDSFMVTIKYSITAIEIKLLFN